MVLAIPYGLTGTFYAAAGAIGPGLLGRAFDYFGRLPDRSLDRYFSSPFDGKPSATTLGQRRNRFLYFLYIK